MFNRIASNRYTCSLCRLRLNQVRHSEQSVLQWPNFTQRRQQSAAPLRVDDDDEEISSRSTVEVKPESSKQSLGSSSQSPSQGNLETSGKRRNQKNYRRWRPHPAESLGINVLGRPAEVLILPNRKRKIAQLVSGEEENGKQPGLQTSLDSESKPISMKEVWNNLDSRKEELGQGKHVFTMSEWKEHRNRLADGFTRTQLEAYLSAAMASESQNVPEKAWLAKGNIKRNIAAQVMMQVWQWKIDDMHEPAPNTVQETIQMPITKNINVNAAKLGYIMLHEKQRLGRLSETLGVQIDVFKKKQKIRLTGIAQALEDAISQLKQFANSIREQTVVIPAQLREPLEESVKSTSVLTMLMRKHKLFITKDNDQLKVVGLARTGADIVLRDLMLMSGMLYTATPSTFFVEHKDEEVTRVPFYDEDISSNSFQDQILFRYMSKSSIDDVDDEHVKAGGRSVRRLAEKLSRHESTDQEKLAQTYVFEVGSLVHEYSLSIGQALFACEAAESVSSALPAPDATVMSSAVVLRQALLPQVLGKSDLTRIGPQQPVAETKGTVQPFLLNIRLQPAEQNASHPPLEILLSGRDASLGIGQKLTVRKAFAIVDQWQHNILLPEKPLDICMTRQSKIDLLGDPSSSVPKKDLRILRQLSSYLGQAQSLDQLQLPSVWRIDVSTLLRNPATRDANSKLSLNVSQNPDKLDSMTAESSTAKDRTTVYMLETLEVLDFASFSFGVAENERFLDHIVCHTESVDAPRQRQILRIGEVPLCRIVEGYHGQERSRAIGKRQAQKWLKHSVFKAYNLVAMLQMTENSVGKPVEVAQPVETVP